MKTLAIALQVSSPHHSKSQGALERFHQSLKSVLWKYCLGTETNWDEGVLHVLFAGSKAVQESLGFSPAELVFGNSVGAPQKALRDS